MGRALLISVVSLGLVVAGCGQSKEDKAKSDVCDARADIQKNVKDLQSLSLGTATADRVKSDLKEIKDDLVKISDAQSKLEGSRKNEVQKANETFKKQVQAVASDLGSSQSLQGAAQHLKSDFAQLAAAYQQSFAPIDCG